MKKYLALPAAALIMVVGIFLFFFIRMGEGDAKALADFSAAYQKYDQAVSAFSTPILASNPESAPAAGDLEQKAGAALSELKTTASARISSLTKNDSDLMKTTLEIADLSEKELAALKAYQSAAAQKGVDLDPLAKEFRDLTSQRQNEYARFLELAGLKK